MSVATPETATLTPPRSPKQKQREDFLKWPLRYQALVMDLGDVFCFWSKGSQPTPISAFDLKKIIESPDWHDYERGKLEKAECFARVNSKFGLPEGHLEQTIKLFREGMQWDHELVSEVRQLRTLSQGELQVVLMTNISQPDFEDLRPVVESWNIFDKIFTSAAAGARKPALTFYQSVLQDIGVDAASTVFVDDKNENVMLAQSTGMHGVLYESTTQVVHELNVLLGDPACHAKDWIKAHAGDMWAVTETGVVIREQFNHLVMLEMSVDRSLLTIHEGLRHWNTFLGTPVLTDVDFPNDFDTTTMALSNLDMPNDVINSVMDEMLEYPRLDGLFPTYFERERPRFCPYVSANILRLFYAQKRSHQVTETLDRILQVLESGAYRFGTRYYQCPDWFLYLVADLCAKNSAAPELEKLRPVLRTHIRAAVGTALSDYAVGLRVVSAQLLGLDDEVQPDLSTLLRNQDSNGSWNRNPWTWKYGRSGMQVGHVGLTTAIATRAIQNAGEDRIKAALRIW